MIKPVTFNTAKNFKANLYALAVRSMLKKPETANLIYKGYGEEVTATVVGTSTIKLGSGALIIQGRMIEIVESENIPIAYTEGHVGQIICRIETCPQEGDEHCSIFARTGATYANIPLTKEVAENVMQKPLREYL